MSENKFTDTLNQLLDQLETVKTEIEKQNARVKVEGQQQGTMDTGGCKTIYPKRHSVRLHQYAR